MEAAIIALAVVAAVQAAIIAVLAGSVPYLWNKWFKVDVKVEELDETIATLCEAAGIKRESPGRKEVDKKA